MQKIAIIPISETGSDIASILQRQLNAKTIQRTQVSAKWNHFDAFIFIGAMGICVRTIASLVEDKHKDPAVVCVDSLGQHVIAVLSGHVGGANDLTHQVASILGADPVITTQSDNAGLWALDTFEQRFDWPIASEVEDMNDCIFAFVNRQPTALLMDVRDEGTDYLEKTLPDHVTLINNIKDAFNKADFTVAPNKKLKTISADFKKAFDLTLVFYKGVTIADPELTLNQLGKKTTKEVNTTADGIKIKGSTKVGEAEKMFDKAFGVTVQIKDKSGKNLVPNEITIGQAARGEYK